MKYVNVIDAKEKFSELVTLLDTCKQDKIILTFNDKPLIEMIRAPQTQPASNPRRFGIAKGKWNLPPDFDEKFVAMDEELLKSFVTEGTK